MDESTRKLLVGALEKHEACVKATAGIGDQQQVISQLVDIESQAWSESALEVENRPMTYRHLLSHLNELALVEERYAACEHDYLKAIAAQRYAELLGSVTDMGKLMELAVRAHPGLRPFVILRLQDELPAALKEVSAGAVPGWLVHLLRQPHEVSNFLSQSSCRVLMEKVQELVKG
ncbi:MAG: hypothetical protein P8180_12095 [Gammaproteobacteria bacterium]|jgi:hypothetical protein